MATLKEEAQAYVPKQIKNIAELPQVSTELALKTERFTDNDGKEFTVKLIEVKGEKFRVPVSVLKNLKAILEEKPHLKLFKVKRSGSGLGTEYTVIPLD
jgi:hypothetical protein